MTNTTNVVTIDAEVNEDPSVTSTLQDDLPTKGFLDDISSISKDMVKDNPPIVTPSAPSYDITSLEDLPTSLIKLSPIETLIVKHAAASKSPKGIATSLGIPQSVVVRVLSNKDVEAYLDSLVKARNKAIEAYLPGLLMEVIEAKIERINNDPEASLADASKRDLADIAKIVADMTQKSQVSDVTKADGVMAFYQQLNIVASSDN